MTERAIPSWLPLLLLPLVLIALFAPLLAGETLFWGLPALQFYPWRQFAFEELGAGRLPSWNPYLGAGAPLLANYQTAIFYPPNWLMLILPGPQAMSLIALLHVIWAGLGMWLFSGELRFSAFGRGISTLAYALSGYLMARLGSFPTADAGAWIPWLFWLAHRVLIRRQARNGGGLALAFGFQLLAGHAQTVWYSAVGLGLYTLWLVVWDQRRQPLRARAAAAGIVGAALALGLALAAVQWVPTAEYLAESQRSGGLDYETLTNLSYHPARLITLLSPNFFGTPADGSYITRGIYFEDAAYIGIIPLIAAVTALVAWMRHRRDQPSLVAVPFWWALVLAGLFFALGRHNPAFRLLYDHVPTFDAFREPVRWLILPTFGLAVLAGIGVDHWGRGKWIVFWSRLSAAGGGAMAVMGLAALELMELESQNLRALAWGLVVLGCWIAGAALLTLAQPVEHSPRPWQIAVLVFVAFDLAWVADGLNPTVPDDFFEVRQAAANPPGRVYWFDDYRQDVTFGSEEEDEVQIEGYFDLTDYRLAVRDWRALRGSLLPNLNMLDRVPALNNNDPLLPSYHSQYVDLIEELGTQSGTLLRAASVDRVYGLTPEGWSGANPALAPGDVTPIWMARQAASFASDSDIKDALRNPGWDPALTVILAGEPLEAREANPVAAAQVEVLEDHPARRRWRITTDGAAYLVIVETWYPGWSAFVDGQPARLYRANLAFQAVAIPSGEHEVTLRYELNHWRTGLAVSLLALLVTAGLVVWPVLRRIAR